MFIGLATGFVDSVVGTGGLISIPFLIFSGLPPKVAIATDRLGILGQNLGSLPKFLKEKKILWKYVPPLAILSTAGAYIGANILITIDEILLTRLVGIAIIAILPLLFIKKELGVKRNPSTRTRKMAGYVVYFLAMVFAASIGGGVGILILYILIIFFGFTIIEANSTDNFSWFFLSLLSLIIFGINGIVDYTLGITLFLGMVAGGYIGAHVAIKKGNSWVKMVLLVAVVISGVKLLFF